MTLMLMDIDVNEGGWMDGSMDGGMMLKKFE